MNQGKTNMGRIEELEAILNKPLVRNNAKEMMRAAIEAIALAKRVGDDDLLAFAEEIKNEIKTMAARHAERLKTRTEKGLKSFQSRIKARHKNHVRLLAAKPAEKVEFAPIAGRTGVNDREKMVVIDQAIKASGMAEMDIKKNYPDIRQSIERIRKNPGFYSLRDAESLAYKIKQLKAMSSRPGLKVEMANAPTSSSINTMRDAMSKYQARLKRKDLAYGERDAIRDDLKALTKILTAIETGDASKTSRVLESSDFGLWKFVPKSIIDWANKSTSSRPGAKAKFETYPSDEAEPWGHDVPRSAKDLEESIAFWTDYANRLDKSLLAYPKALSKASGYKKESLLRELERKKSDIKKVKKIVLEYKALLAKLKSNPNMSHINGKGRLIKLQRSVYPAAKRNRLIDPNSINSWEIQRGQKITSAGKGTWAFTDPYGKLVIVPILGTFKEAVAWLNKNGDYKHSNDYYKVQMSRPGVKVK
jgi:hypothetical protein